MNVEISRAFCTRNEQKIIDAQKKLDDCGKPPAYKYMPQNRPVYPVKIKACAVEDNSVCSCKPTDEDPCGPESNCMNRITQFECHPATCPAGADRLVTVLTPGKSLLETDESLLEKDESLLETDEKFNKT